MSPTTQRGVMGDLYVSAEKRTPPGVKLGATMRRSRDPGADCSPSESPLTRLRSLAERRAEMSQPIRARGVISR